MVPQADRVVVPDLVFNELRFLQKPTEHQDEPARADSPPRGKRHERKRVQDEEISAYFNANNGAKSQSQLPQERVQHREESQDPKRNRDLEEAQPVRRSATQVESGGKAPLEPGRPTADARRQRDRSESAEPYPWSESPVNPPTQARSQPGQTIKKRQPRKDRSSLSHHSSRFELAREISRNPQTAVLGSVLNDNFRASKGRVDRSTSGQEKGIAPPRNEQRLHRPASITTARSRPQDTSQHRGTKQDELEQVADGLNLPRDFQTSDILEIRERQEHSDRTESFGQVDAVVHVESDKENASPGSSVDQLLDQAKQAIVRRSTAPQAQFRGARTSRESLVGREVGSEADVSGAIEHPPLRQAREHYERSTTNASCIGLRSVPNMSMGAFERGKALHPRDLDDSMPEAATFELALPFEDEMLDDGLLVDNMPCQDDYADLQNLGANEVVRRVFAVPETRLFEKQAEQMWRADEMYSEEWPAMEHARPSEASLQPQDETMEAMAGFWKPHRLY
ncbi:hypothetical protein BDY17DRAFT_101591 [Neohortaea acidophila]|uniref:Uncharacterized protein n=1 Tax=Neohortaea acidophila TaxID=245834 RepID=A0A6A6Q010_9PEZI|nr:uncharacterized protein BDY17DRAFT_101591 [Neohortaea acidophila]KAF2485361.1 hypothetical protein BDY17DRAFT_101591 [Neohortaea acidophila]